MPRAYTLTLIEFTYPPPVDGEDYCPDPSSVGRWEVVCTGLHELVETITDHVGFCEPDVMPHDGRARWFQSADWEQDYRTGEYTERSAHLPDDMDPRARRAVCYAILN